jgi:hypothetical protein
LFRFVVACGLESKCSIESILLSFARIRRSFLLSDSLRHLK